MNLALVEQLKAEPRVLICGEVRTNEVGWWTANPQTGDRIEWIPPFCRCNALCPLIYTYIHTHTHTHVYSGALPLRQLLDTRPRQRVAARAVSSHSHIYKPIDANITRIDQSRQIETHDMHTQAGRPAPAAEYELPCQRLRGASGGVRSILKRYRGRGRGGMKMG